MWLALLLISSLLSAIEAGRQVQYFLPGLRSLPHWPQFRSGEIDALLVLTVVVLLLPKALGALLALRDRAVLRQYGGAARLGAGLLIEQLFSMLLAPSMMLFHSAFVVQTLCGRTVSWNAQERSRSRRDAARGVATPVVARAGRGRLGRAHAGLSRRSSSGG